MNDRHNSGSPRAIVLALPRHSSASIAIDFAGAANVVEVDRSAITRINQRLADVLGSNDVDVRPLPRQQTPALAGVAAEASGLIRRALDVGDTVILHDRWVGRFAPYWLDCLGRLAIATQTCVVTGTPPGGRTAVEFQLSWLRDLIDLEMATRSVDRTFVVGGNEVTANGDGHGTIATSIDGVTVDVVGGRGDGGWLTPPVCAALEAMAAAPFGEAPDLDRVRARLDELSEILPAALPSVGPDEAERRREQSVPFDAGPVARAAGRRVDLVWLYRSNLQKSGLMMRGRQLSDMARRHLGDIADVRYLGEESFDTIRNSVVIVTRSYLDAAVPSELEQLRANGNAVCVDYIDWPTRDELDGYVDLYIASSIGQLGHYAATIGEDRCCLVLHHADPELREVVFDPGFCNIGYFGEVPNAKHHKKLLGIIDFVQTNNSEFPSRRWIDKATLYNMHYSVRDYTFPKRGKIPGSFKPFTKGANAARCGANIIVPRDESDAEHFLGGDYPYLLDDDALPAVIEMIDTAHESYGTDVWRDGLERMRNLRAATSPHRIMGQLTELIARATPLIAAAEGRR